MALSKKAKEALRRAVTEDKVADELEAQLEAADSVAQITTADATDPAETQSLANELKAKVNELLAAMQSDKEVT